MLQLSPLDVDGVWATENGRAHVEIVETEDGSIRGQIIWYASFEEDQAEGETGILGVTLLEDYERRDDGWRNGTIYNLKNGRAFRSAIFRTGEDTLNVQGCLGPFCRDQHWTRVPEDQIVRLQRKPVADTAGKE
ncbi:hypothetical protein GCM10007148_00460 [Parvularcula lutaonensis]|nr:hypothetical protein GCM10007148_00460 [Parvularcula lutaonensis]